MDKIIYSIIISAYNNRDTISTCIDSIIKVMKSNKDFEIIIIDDCASDGTTEILKKKYEIFDFIKIIYKKQNEGLLLSRLDGIKRASGKFCTFIDADDVIDVENWNKCLSIVSERNVDIIEFDSTYVYRGSREKLFKGNIKLKPFKSKIKNKYYKAYIKKMKKNVPFDEVVVANNYILKALRHEIPKALWHRFYKRQLLLDVVNYIESICNPYKDFRKCQIDDGLLTPIIFVFAKDYYVEDLNHYKYTIFSTTSNLKQIRYSIDKQKAELFFERKRLKILLSLFELKNLSLEYKFIRKMQVKNLLSIVKHQIKRCLIKLKLKK